METLKIFIFKFIFIFVFLSCTQNLNGVQKPIKVLSKVLNTQPYRGKIVNLEYSDKLSTRYIFQDNVVEWVEDTIFVENKSGDIIFNLILNDSSKVFLKNYLEHKEKGLVNGYE